ncbi:hypothetical protein HAX54_019190, partial [Datura stramonium]|nr:hypothetical protein [Datura stramonium]
PIGRKELTLSACDNPGAVPKSMEDGDYVGPPSPWHQWTTGGMPVESCEAPISHWHLAENWAALSLIGATPTIHQRKPKLDRRFTSCHWHSVDWVADYTPTPKCTGLS